jgi:predicted Zn-dependent protease
MKSNLSTSTSAPSGWTDAMKDAMKKDHLSRDQFDKLSIDDFGNTYGRDGELAADREGVKLAVAAGYSPHAAVEML